MRAHDINYYLANRPPVFLAGAAGIGAVALALALVLLVRLSGWAVALHLILIERHPVAGVWAESLARLDGRRRRLVGELAIWLLVRLALAGLAGLGVGALLGQAGALSGDSLRRAAVLVAAMLAVSALVQVCLSALGNGALAGLLLRLHRAAGGASPPAATAAVPRRSLTLATLALVALGIAGFALWRAAAVVDRLAAPREVVVIAHRGAAAVRPENTLASFRKAIEDGADWVEFDVQENADGTVIVAHDSDFMKLAGVPTKVWEATDAQLATIDIGSHFDPVWSDERTPTLDQVLAEAKGRTKLIVELKSYGHDVDLEHKVATRIDAAGMAGDVAVMSLKVGQVTAFQAVRPTWRTGLLAATALGDLSGMKADFLAVSTRAISTSLVDRAHAAGKDVYVWTVDDPVAMSRMISMGVDGLITNNPALARQVVAEQAALPVVGRLALWLADAFGLDPLARVPDASDA